MRSGVLPMTPTQSKRFLNGLVRHPLAEETEIPNFPHQEHVDNFFDSQGIAHKEFIPEGQTVNAEFYKGVMVRLLKHIQQVCPAPFCSQVFFLLHDNAPTHKAARLPVFDPKKCYNPLSPPILSRFISARLISVPQVEN